MAIPQVSGPVSLWVAASPVRVTAALRAAAATQGSATSTTGGTAGALAVALARLAATPTFLGTGETGPTVRKRRHYAPVMNDLAGPVVPFDKIRGGQDAIVSVSLTRWNPPVYRSIASVSASGLPGFETSADRGTLMMTEGQSFVLYLRYPFFDSHPAMAAQGMIPGYRFFNAMLDGEDDEETGTRANKEHLTFYCGGLWDTPTNSWSLYDHNVAGVPVLVPN